MIHQISYFNKVRLLLLVSIFFPLITFAETSICEQLKLKDCNASKRSLGRSSGASFPNTASAALNNPAALSMDRGIGVEGIFYGSESRFSLVSGTGRIGAAISTTPADETFFGQFALETTNAYRTRRIEGGLYKTKNFNLALGMNLFGKDGSQKIRVDIGGVYKRNQAKNVDFFGGGAILTINKIFSIGMASYSDVLYEDNRDKVVTEYDQFGGSYDIYYPDDPANLTDINVKVDTLMLGFKFANFAIDHLTIKSTYEDEILDSSFVKILNLSVFYKKWIFSYGLREENSFRERYKDEVFVEEDYKYARFIGAQYALNKNLLVGLFNNYFLLGESTFGLTYFL